MLVPLRDRYLMAVCTTPTSAFATLGLSIRTLSAPYLHLFLFGALDAPLTHFPVVLDLCFRKLSVLPEYDVEAQAEHA